MIRKKVYRFKRKNEEYRWMEIIERNDYTIFGILIYRSDVIIESNM